MEIVVSYFGITVRLMSESGNLPSLARDGCIDCLEDLAMKRQTNVVRCAKCVLYAVQLLWCTVVVVVGVPC